MVGGNTSFYSVLMKMAGVGSLVFTVCRWLIKLMLRRVLQYLKLVDYLALQCVGGK
jgi:hypothetical protein